MFLFGQTKEDHDGEKPNEKCGVLRQVRTRVKRKAARNIHGGHMKVVRI